MAGMRRCVVIFALIFVFLFPASSHAFNRELYQVMVKDALSFCPKGLKKYLKSRPELIYKGVQYGDLNTGAIDPLAAQRVFDLTVERLKKGEPNNANIFMSYGTMAYFLSETVSPGACRTLDTLLPDVVTYDGHDEVVDAASRVKSLVEESRQFHGVCDAEIVGQAYVAALNVVVDFWISAYSAGGRDPGEVLTAGAQIDHSGKPMLTAEELEAIRLAEEELAAAKAAKDKELAEMAAKGVITKEVLVWKAERKEKREIEKAINKYEMRMEWLKKREKELDSLKVMTTEQMEKSEDVKSEIFEITNRLELFESDPDLAIENERSVAW